MNPKLNRFDRIMMPVLALTSLVIMIASYPAGYDGTPAAPLWGFAIVGFAYVLYQAIRVGSPGLTAATAAVVMVGYLGPGLVNWRSADDYLRNTIWNPLGRYSLASIAMTIVLVAIFALPLEAGVFTAWIVQHVRRGRQAPPERAGAEGKAKSIVLSPPSLPPAAQSSPPPRPSPLPPPLLPPLPPPLPFAASTQPRVIPSGLVGSAAFRGRGDVWSPSTIITLLYATAVFPPIGLLVGLFALIKRRTRAAGTWSLIMAVACLATWLVLTPIGGILFGLVLITIIVALSRSPQCGHCGQTLPRVRVPATFRQAWRGGWICPHCGSEVDRKGRVLASPDGLAIDPTLPPPLVAMPPPIATPNTAPGETAGAAIILPEPPVIARAEANGRRGPSSPP